MSNSAANIGLTSSHKTASLNVSHKKVLKTIVAMI